MTDPSDVCTYEYKLEHLYYASLEEVLGGTPRNESTLQDGKTAKHTLAISLVLRFFGLSGHELPQLLAEIFGEDSSTLYERYSRWRSIWSLESVYTPE